MRLADAIAQLRAELSLAREAGKGQDIRFAVGDITVELALEFTTTVEAGGGVKIFSMFDFSGKASAVDKAANKLTLKLTIDDQGEPASKLLIADDNGPRSKAKPRIAKPAVE